MQGNMDNDEIKCFVGCVFESAGFVSKLIKYKYDNDFC